MIEPTLQDTVFTDSPDAGESECTCSRCGAQIPEGDIPVRLWPVGTELEYRYCRHCCQASGMTSTRMGG